MDFSGTEFTRADATGSSPDKPARLMGNRWLMRYEDMAKMLEELLTEYGYYDTEAAVPGEDVAVDGSRKL